MKQNTKTPSDGFKPREFPPNVVDFEIIAGKIGYTVRENEKPGIAESRNAIFLNKTYTKLKNEKSFLNVLIM